MAENGNVCRVCFSDEETVELIDWHETMMNTPEQMSWLDCFRLCTGLTVEVATGESATNARTHHLCSSCTQELEAAYQFIVKAQKADHVLREQLSSVISQVHKVGHFECVIVKKEEANTTSETTDVLQCEAAALLEKPKNSSCAASEKKATKADPLQNNASLLTDSPSPAVKTESLNSPAMETESNERPVKKTESLKRPAKKMESLKRPAKKTMALKRAKMLEVVSCEQCSRRMERRHLKQHIARYHRPNLLLCHACPRTFSVRSNLITHQLTHEEKRAVFTCEQCGKELLSKHNYKKHLETHSANRKPTHQCDQCEKIFLHKSSLDMHQLLHKGVKIACNLCDKSFVRQIDLKTHQRSHTGERIYECTKCEKAFTQKRVLNKHLLRHEDISYNCSYCGKKYSSYERLFYHCKEHTGMSFKCATCEKEFAELYKVKRHIKGVHKVDQVEEIEKYVIDIRKEPRRKSLAIE